jgi:hypothetical protein
VSTELEDKWSGQSLILWSAHSFAAGYCLMMAL